MEATAELGQATSILPVISTLTFGFAIAAVLAHDPHTTHDLVIVLLTISAGCSLWTTAYSVLEQYYFTMISQADHKAEYMSAEHLKHSSCDRGKLARAADRASLRFRPLRHVARNALWLSVLLILVAIAVDAAAKHGYHWVSFVVGGVVIASAASLLAIVAAFRSVYLPLIAGYHTDVEVTERGPASNLARAQACSRPAAAGATVQLELDV